MYPTSFDRKDILESEYFLNQNLIFIYTYIWPKETFVGKRDLFVKFC